MNPETASAPRDPASVRPASDDLDRLRRDQSAMLALLVLVTASVTALVFRMTLIQRRTVSFQAPIVQQIEAQEMPRQRAIVAEFEKFGASHPDFVEQVLRKYGLAGGAPTNAPSR